MKQIVASDLAICPNTANATTGLTLRLRANTSGVKTLFAGNNGASVPLFFYARNLSRPWLSPLNFTASGQF